MELPVDVDWVIKPNTVLQRFNVQYWIKDTDYEVVPVLGTRSKFSDGSGIEFLIYLRGEFKWVESQFCKYYEGL